MSKKAVSMILAFCLILASLVPNMPLVAAAAEKEGTVIDVTTFGADPSGAADSAPAIQAAIAAAKEASQDGEVPVTISFPKGRYDIYPDLIEARELYISNTVGADQGNKMKKIGILLENMKNVTVDGNGSLFMYHGKMTTFAAISCENVTFRNFEVNFQVPTVVDITVEAVSGNTATIYVPECYNYQIDGTNVNWLSDVSPYTGQRYWQTRNAMVYTQRYNVKTGLTWRGNTNNNPVFSNVSRIEDLGNHRLKFTYSNRSQELEQGISYQMRPTVRDHAGTFFWKSKDVTLDNLDIRFLHGFGMVGQSSENITMRDVDFETEKGSGRTTAGYADFIQMSGCKGKIDISECTFSNPHDDPINVHGTFMKVVQKVSARKFKVRYMHGETAGFPNFFVGDQVEFMTAGNMIPVANSVATVTEVQGPTGDSGAANSGTNSLTDIIITLDRDVPSEIAVNSHVVENITYTPEVHIHDNIFKETPTRGILCTTRKPVVIEDNVFDGMGMASIYISNDAQGWYESGPTRDVLIRNNVFTRGKAQAIFVEPTNPTVSTSATVHDNMRIEGNKFFMENTRVLDAKSVSNLTFKNNEIYRMDPMSAFTLTANKTSLAAGESAQVTANASMNRNTQQLYRFVGCKAVKIEGNRYDGGLNAGSSYNSMQASDITVTNDAMTIGGGNQLADSGAIGYESSDETVVKVSASGAVSAVGAGTAEVRAYMLVGGRKLETDAVTFTVTGQAAGAAPTGITVTAAAEQIAEGGTVQYTAAVSGEADADKTVTWSVVNAKTGEPAANASISNTGLLTAQTAGVVEVAASTVNGLEARKLLVIQGEGCELASNFEVNPNNDPDRWHVTADGKLEMQFALGGLYQEQTANNVVAGTIPDTDLTNATVTIRIDGRTETGWEDLGLYLYKDADNYVALQRKHRSGSIRKIALVREENRSASENWATSGGSEITYDAQTVYFKFVKTGNNVDGYYSPNGTDWTKVASCTAAFLGNNFKVAVATLNNGSANNTKITYSELKVNDKAVPFGQAAQKPSVSIQTPSYTEASDALRVQTSASAGADVVVKWAVADTADGNYSLVSGLEGNDVTATKAMSGKYVKAAVVAVSASGSVSDVAWSSAVRVTGEGSGAVTGNAKSSNAFLKTAEVSGFTGFAKMNKFYSRTAAADEKTIDVKFEADHAKASVETKLNGKIVENTAAGLKLVSGQNMIEATVTAEDGMTTMAYRFLIMRTGSSNANLAAISVDGKPLTGVTAEQTEYAYKASVGAKSVTVGVTPEEENARVVITAGSQVTEGAEAEISLTAAVNRVIISIYSETSAAPKRYVLNVKLPSMDNAELELLGVNEEKAVVGFDPAVTEYAVTSVSRTNVIYANPQEENAKVEITYKNDTTIGTRKVVSAEEGENRIQIKVTSADGTTTKAYTLLLNVTNETALSSLEWKSESSGDPSTNPTRKDKSCGNNPITLWDGQKEVTFEKGIGTHATSNIVYDFEGKVYQSFEAYVGIDREIATATDQQHAKVTFKVYAIINGSEVQKYAGPEMLYTSTMEHVVVTGLEQATGLKLVVEMGTEAWADHADWADAKLISKLEEPTIVQHQVAYEAQPAEGGSVKAKVGISEDRDGCLEVLDGENVELTAAANKNYTFLGWYAADGTQVSEQEVYLVTNVTKDMQFIAKFEKDASAEVPKTELQGALEDAQKIDLNGYTKESGDVLREALANAQKVFANANATEAEVKEALEKLAASISGLKKLTIEEPPTGGTPGNEKEVPKVGRTVEYKGVLYKVTLSAAANGTVTAEKLQKKNKKKVVIPAAVKIEGYTFKVTAISDKAFQKSKKLKSVVIGSNVKRIGKRSFFKCKKLANITFKGQKVSKIGRQAWKGTAAKAKVYVPKKMKAKKLKKLQKKLKTAGLSKKAVYKKKK